MSIRAFASIPSVFAQTAVGLGLLLGALSSGCGAELDEQAPEPRLVIDDVAVFAEALDNEIHAEVRDVDTDALLHTTEVALPADQLEEAAVIAFAEWARAQFPPPPELESPADPSLRKEVCGKVDAGGCQSCDWDSGWALYCPCYSVIAEDGMLPEIWEHC